MHFTRTLCAIPSTKFLYLDEKRRLVLVKRIRKQIDKFEIGTERPGLQQADFFIYKFDLSRNMKKPDKYENDNYSCISAFFKLCL